MREIGTHKIELREQVPIITEDCQGDAKAGHNAEIIFFGSILEKRLQHAERENHCGEWKGDSHNERKVLLRTVPKPA